MSNANQLILEIMLLRERYSARDIAEARNRLLNSGANDLLIEITKLIDKGGVRRTAKRPSRTIQPESIAAAKNKFIETLKYDSAADKRRLASIAGRLGLEVADPGKRTAELIIRQVKAMSDDEAQELMKPRRASGSPDQNYLNLASFLVGKSESDS